MIIIIIISMIFVCWFIIDSVNKVNENFENVIHLIGDLNDRVKELENKKESV